MNFYTGVGSRKTPPDILELMRGVAAKLARFGVALRSGGADGADSAFEVGCNSVGGRKEIFYARMCTPEAIEIAKQFHPAWHACTEFARKLHGRNAFQVLGSNLTSPSKVLICWTPDGCTSHVERSRNTGGTGTAISIAEHYGVPVYNLARADHFYKWFSWCKPEPQTPQQPTGHDGQ